MAIERLFNVDGDDRINKNHFSTQIQNASDKYDDQIKNLKLSSEEGLILQDLKQKLLDKNGLTLEDLFKSEQNRSIPSMTTNQFKTKISNLDLGLSKVKLNRLVGIFDDGVNGNITV